MKKSKNRTLGEADQQHDSLLDVRNFYPSNLDEDEHFEEAFILKHQKDQ